jgi:hypothetical protein
MDWAYVEEVLCSSVSGGLQFHVLMLFNSDRTLLSGVINTLVDGL